MDKANLDEIRQYSSDCLRILIAAKHVKPLHLYVYMYNMDNHTLEVRTRLKGHKRLLFRILRHVKTLELDKLAWHPGSEAIRCSDAVSTIERKNPPACEEWVNHLHNHELLDGIAEKAILWLCYTCI
jgi:hypothetical protein